MGIGPLRSGSLTIRILLEDNALGAGRFQDTRVPLALFDANRVGAWRQSTEELLRPAAEMEDDFAGYRVTTTAQSYYVERQPRRITESVWPCGRRCWLPGMRLVRHRPRRAQRRCWLRE